MSTLLRLYVGERWPQSRKLAWALFASTGALLQEGVSDPSHWPASDDCDAVISGAQVSWLRARLPAKIPRGEAARLLANALEPKLVDEPDRQHLTVTDRHEGEVSVLVIARERLRLITAQFAAIDRPLSRAYCELQTAPVDEKGWHLALGADCAVLRRHVRDGASVDTGGDGIPPPLLTALISAERAAGRPDPNLIVHAPDEGGAPDLSAWQSALGLEVVRGEPYRWHAVRDEAQNLLHGEFSPSHRGHAWWDRTRPALWLVAAVAAADLLMGGAQVGWLRYQIAAREQGIERAFQSAFPNIPAVEPFVQARRQLDTLRSPRGLLRGDDALTLLAHLADSLGPDGRDAVQALRFSEGALEVTVSPALAAKIESVRRQLAIRGLDAALAPGGGAPRLIVRRQPNR